MNKDLIQQLVSRIKCYKCGMQFEIDNIDVLEYKDNTWFLNVYCKNCQKQSFVIAIVKLDNQLEISTDLTEQELERFSNSSPISSDYLLDLHDFLKDFGGDFIEHFNINKFGPE